MSLPDLSCPPVHRHRSLPDERALNAADAVLVIGAPEPDALLRRLPQAPLWRRLHAREPAEALQWRSSALANARQTQVVLGYAKRDANAFERLAFAGRLLAEVSARKPARLMLIVGQDLQAGWGEAVLAAALAHSFALPDFSNRRTRRWRLQRIDLYGAGAFDLARALASARGGNLVRWLTALPPNMLDARAYRQLLGRLARRHRLRLRWLSESALHRLGAGAFLAVARGNAARTAGIAELSYRPRPGPLQLALVGKGVLFDTGGVNLKSHRHMLDMHIDMSGSAVALATLLALAELRAPLNASAWLAITENNIGPNAYRPQEVVRALNGTTIQVIHSDAEGRMVLADALALATRARPRLTVDFGTLTGACVNALTERYSGVFSNRERLLTQLLAAGSASGERVWSFPLDADFDADLQSPVADVLQCAVEGKGDHILAARFLKRFVANDLPWIHVDLSSATRRGGLAHVNTEITGFGVRLMLELLLTQRAAAGTRRRAA